MKTRIPFIFASSLIFLTLIACGTSQAVLDATATPVPIYTATPIPGWIKFEGRLPMFEQSADTFYIQP